MAWIFEIETVRYSTRTTYGLFIAWFLWKQLKYYRGGTFTFKFLFICSTELYYNIWFYCYVFLKR